MIDLTPSPDVLAAHLAGEAVLLHVGTKQRDGGGTEEGRTPES
jgi:hypothetical protein